jgi:serine/threonine protein kinase
MEAAVSEGSLNQQDRSTSITKTFETFGNYVFLKRLAAGGMAEVFLARPASHTGNGRIQVVKRLLPHVADDAMFLQMFQTEIQVILGFNHPHVVQLHDFGDSHQRPYIAMEYIEGKNLKEITSQFIARKEKMPIPMALGLISQGAAGLSYAHTFVNKVTGETVNAIHRDVSPHNLIVSYDGNLKVIDFGIAKAASGSTHEATSAGTIKGKIAYLSPEQIHGQAIDARSDVFSLGIVAWELLTLKRPFTKEGDTEITIIGKISNCDQYIVPPSILNSDVPPDVDGIILKALRKNPAERFSTAAEFQSALRQAMQKHFPKYSYSDTAQTMSSLFSKEILMERSELRELNQLAQTTLRSQPGEATVVMSGLMDTVTHKPGIVTGVFNGLRAVVPANDNVDDRLQKIESLMKQKASVRHYMMLAFYVLSIVLIKLDNQYSFLNFIFEQKEARPANVSASVTSATMGSSEMASKTPARKLKKAAAPHKPQHR